MEIAGFIKNSFVDYPGVIASVVFTPFCNFNCWYCHNKDIINETKGTINENEVFEFLKQRKKFIDGVVVSGGEPTLQNDLIIFIKKLKEMGFNVKLDTNGTNLKVVKELVDKNLIDFIAMDIKAPLNKYTKIICKKFSESKILESINYIKKCGIKHEFRTTFSPDLTADDVVEIAKLVGKDHCYTLQQYNMNSEDAPSPHTETEIKVVGKKIEGLVKDFKIKGLKTIF